MSADRQQRHGDRNRCVANRFDGDGNQWHGVDLYPGHAHLHSFHSLASGGAYPAITVVVNVAGIAPPSVTNTATVSGGGDIIPLITMPATLRRSWSCRLPEPSSPWPAMEPRIPTSGTNGYMGDGGPATGAALLQPEGVAVDPAGNVYIADLDANRVREVSAASA